LPKVGVFVGSVDFRIVAFLSSLPRGGITPILYLYLFS